MTVLTKRSLQQNLETLREKFPSLTDEDLEFVEGREQEFIDRIHQRTGQPREVIEGLMREKSPTVDELIRDSKADLDQSRGSGIPEDTSHSGASGI